jgi:hypothetical protein
MLLIKDRRSVSPLVVVLGLCAILAAPIAASGAMGRFGRHHRLVSHHRVVSHERFVSHHRFVSRHRRAARHFRHQCAVTAHRGHRRHRWRHRAHRASCAIRHRGHGKANASPGRRSGSRLTSQASVALIAPAPPRTNPAVEGVAGLVKTRIDAKSEFDSFPLGWFTGLTRVLAYPPGGDRYAAARIPTLAYHDAWTAWGSSGATHVAEYVAWVKRDREHGYLGQFMDDINFAGGNIAGTPAQYANLIEAVRAALGPGGVIEINAQMWNLKAMLGNPDVQRALSYVNVVTKEFNVDPSSGISSPGAYGQYLEFVEGLRAKGIGITNTGDSHYNSEADKEYSLASYLLVNTGLDFIGFAHQSPLSEYAALRGMNLGEQTAPRAQLPSGLWTRTFTHGEAIVAPPGTSGSVALPRPMTRIGTLTPVTSVALGGGQGAVLIG